MAFIPFIYFTLLTIYWWKTHKCFDVCVYMSSLYALSSFCSIFLVYGNLLGEGGVLYDEFDLELNPLPTFLFCALHTFCILPFTLIYKKDLRVITPPQSLILTIVSWTLIAVALLNLYLVADSTIEILSGNLETVRLDHYKGLMSPAQIKAESLPSIFGYFYYLNVSTLVALPIFFYYLCFEHKPWWFKSLLLFTSLSVPIAGIQAVDRTEIMFYGLMFIFCLVFFNKMLSKKLKRIMSIASIPIAVLFLVYVIAVSQARFSDKDGGAATSALQYTGQGYINFCYFWENHNSDYIATEREFPLINHALYKIDSNPDRRGDRSGKQGFFISVFPTYLGDILLDISEIGLFIWVSYFFLICLLTIKASHREEFNVGEVITIFILAVIPVFGIFYYRYFYYTYTFLLVITAAVYILSKIKFIYR